MTDTMTQQPAGAARSRFPSLRTVGIDGLLVSFADRLDEPANRAALAFRAAVDAAGWDEVEETSTSLVSAYIRFDPVLSDREALQARLNALLISRDWSAAPLPKGRKLWRVPTCYDAEFAPQLDEAAAAAGIDRHTAIAQLSTARVRVQTIGFAPGQPYLGALPAAWDIPRQTHLTERVPAGALTVAIRQMVLFSVPSPTGWRHVGQTALPLFRPAASDPFLLRPGDEVIFDAVDSASFQRRAAEADLGGATWEALP